MQKEVNKGKILGKLLKSPKTTAELARELGYVNKEGIARYNIINKDLKNLEESGYIKSERIKVEQKPGNNPTLYSILFSFKSLSNMCEEYPYLIVDVQENNSAIDSISLEKFCTVPILYNKCYFEKATDYNDCLNLFSNITKTYEKHCKEYMYPINDLHEDSSPIDRFVVDYYAEPLQDFKKKLQLSTEFFKIFLIDDNNKLIDNIRKLVVLSNGQENNEFFTEDISLDNFTIRMKAFQIIDIIFMSCIIMDIMKGQLNKKAEEYIFSVREKYNTDGPRAQKKKVSE